MSTLIGNIANAGPAVNPYLMLQNAFQQGIYPTPSQGFEARLIILLALSLYLFIITLVFLGVYIIALRKSHKPIWAWRMVARTEGRYITGNIQLQVAANLITSILIGLEVKNSLDIFVLHKSQRDTFVWRNAIWLVVWLQGWISGFAIQSCLILKNRSSPWLSPRIINTIYVGFPIIAIVGLLTPGLLASASWNYLCDQYAALDALLTIASDIFIASGQPSPSIAEPMQEIFVSFKVTLDIFYNQYLYLNLVWAVASLILVFLNATGIWLIVKLHRQIRFTLYNVNESSELNDLSPIPARPRNVSYQPHSTFLHLPESLAPAPPFNVEPKPTLTSYSSGMSYDPAKGWSATPEDVNKRGSVTCNSQKLKQVGAMQKLERDLIITISGVTAIALSFAANALLLAILRFGLYQRWATAEVGITLLPWVYLILQSTLVTSLTVNQVRYNMRDAPILPRVPPSGSPYAFSTSNSFLPSLGSSYMSQSPFSNSVQIFASPTRDTVLAGDNSQHNPPFVAPIPCNLISPSGSPSLAGVDLERRTWSYRKPSPDVPSSIIPPVICIEMEDHDADDGHSFSTLGN